MSFNLLDQADEDNLHAKRLLNIEEKSFKRVSKRLLAPTTPIQSYLSRRASDKSSDADGDVSTAPVQNGSGTAENHAAFLKSLARFRQDCILDFAAFDSSIARIQFLRSANERERIRYANEKEEIERKAQSVRNNTVKLRLQLEEAQKTMEIRKGYDVLADKVMKDDKTKKTRDELRVGSEKLRGEIEELQREAVELQVAWKDRREQLANVAAEGNKLRRVVRDEKEPEHGDQTPKDEGEDREHEREDEEGLLGVREGEGGSNVGTPRPMDGTSTPLPGLHESGGMTPRSIVADVEISSPNPVKQGGDEIDMEMVENQEGGTIVEEVENSNTKMPDDMDVS